MNEQPIICYTRNFEDVILQRVFADVTQGCYVDAGSAAPVKDSNTYALYTKGWRGIGVDPIEFSDWPVLRPDDVFVRTALGASPGKVLFHVYDSTLQISTASPDIRVHWSINGGLNPSRSLTVPVRTLNDVLEEHLAGRTLHLVSIDVEGMEREVLQGFDLRRYRPWVMVLEAVAPGTPTPAHQGWEPLILSSGYQMVYFDGVNRFYLADEQSHLRNRFQLPPNVWDNFISFEQMQLEQRLAELEKRLR